MSERNKVGRHLLSSLLVVTSLLAGHVALAEQILNVELSGGVGVTAYNLGTDTALAPPFIQLQGAFHPLEIGPVNMGPSLALPLGFYKPETQGNVESSWRPQLGLVPGWQVYGRPSVDFAWIANVGFDFVLTPESGGGVDFVWGFELDGSIAYFLTAGLAVTAGLRYAFFYGVDPIHVFSGQIGVMISYEVGR